MFEVPLFLSAKLLHIRQLDCLCILLPEPTGPVRHSVLGIPMSSHHELLESAG